MFPRFAEPDQEERPDAGGRGLAPLRLATTAKDGQCHGSRQILPLGRRLGPDDRWSLHAARQGLARPLPSGDDRAVLRQDEARPTDPRGRQEGHLARFRRDQYINRLWWAVPVATSGR